MSADEHRRPIPVAGPSITAHEVDLVSRAVESAWYEHANDVVAEFEHSFAAAVGRRHAITLPSCTSALHLALAGLDIGAGDEVIVPDATWIATSAPIDYVSAEPVFVDVDPTTWCVDPAAVESAITPRTRAVIAVDLYGGMPDIDALAALCDRHGIALIEDAAEAIGSAFHGRPAGSFGVASTFSFHGSKTLTTGEGGMLVTDDDRLHQRALVLRDHGRQAGDTQFRNREVAFKYKMSSLQAALGQAQLDRLDELVDAKRQVFSWYREGLAPLLDDGLAELNAEPPATRNSYWMSTLVLDPSIGLSSEDLGRRLGEEDISTRPFFHPLSSLDAYAGRPGAASAHTPVAARLGETGINLPSALRLTSDEVARVCDQVQLVVRDALSVAP